MRVLTVQQPWAWAIVEGGKDVENRTQLWSYRGPLAIHAGTRLSDRGFESPLIQAATTDASYHGDDVIRFQARGAVIGVVDLVDVHHYAGSGPGAVDCCESEWAEESYDEHGGKTRLDIVHLVLENPRPIAPIPARGRLGLWTPDADLLGEIQEALR